MDIQNLVENLENIFDYKKNKTTKRTVHEQNNGTIFAVCCTGTSTLYSRKIYFFFLSSIINDIYWYHEKFSFCKTGYISEQNKIF